MSELHHSLCKSSRTVGWAFLLLSLALSLSGDNTNLPLADAMAMLAHGAEAQTLESEPVGSAAAEVPPAADVTKKVLEMPPFERYEVILERQPFGATTAANAAQASDSDPSQAEMAQEEQKLARQIHMVAVNRTPAGRTAVGFVDKAAKPEKNYYLNVGESVDGFTVIEASFTEETATLTKDEVTITLKLGQGLVAGAASAAAAPAAAQSERQAALPVAPPAARTAAAARSTMQRRPTPAEGGAAPGGRTAASESFRERLFRQRAEREAAEAARQKRAALDAEARAEKITKEELEKKTREININLIKQGMSPISPITLTPEEDAEMVRLGVFEER